MASVPSFPLGIVLSTVTDTPLHEQVALGRLAEAHGYANVLVNEGRGDALAVSRRSRPRHAPSPSAPTSPTSTSGILPCAATARTIAELSGAACYWASA